APANPPGTLLASAPTSMEDEKRKFLQQHQEQAAPAQNAPLEPATATVPSMGLPGLATGLKDFAVRQGQDLWRDIVSDPIDMFKKGIEQTKKGDVLPKLTWGKDPND